MSNLKKWFLETSFLALKTAAQTAVGVIGGASLFSEVSWAAVGSAVLMAVVTTFLMHVSELDVDGLLEPTKDGDLG